MRWSPDGTKLATGGADQSIVIWNPINGAPLLELNEPGGVVTSLAWSPDSSMVVLATRLAGEGGEAIYPLRIWDAETGELRYTLTGHTQPVTGISWASNGVQIAAGARNGTVYIWEVSTQDDLTQAPAIDSSTTNPPPEAFVNTSSLNVRTGPGIDYDRIGTVKQSDALDVIGRNTDCSWLQVITPAGAQGWISGSAQYVTRNVPCDSIPVVSVSPPVAPPPVANTPTPPATSEGQPIGVLNTEEKCNSYEQAKDYKKAIECYENLMREQPDNYSAYDNLMRIHSNLEEYQKSIEIGLKWLDISSPQTDQNSRANTYSRIGVAYYYLGDFKSAITYLHKGAQIEAAPQNTVNNLIWLAHSYRANGQPDEACTTYQKTLELAQQIDYPWAVQNALEGLKNCR